jgi:hypothetical protein
VTDPVITDREVQLARDRAREAGDDPLRHMLEQLLDFREHGRAAVAEHDFRIYYNGGISQMTTLVNQSGCAWWQCTRPALTPRMRRERSGESCRLCREHADEGEAKGLWHDDHPNNVRWKATDANERVWEAKRAAERASEALP